MLCFAAAGKQSYLLHRTLLWLEISAARKAMAFSSAKEAQHTHRSTSMLAQRRNGSGTAYVETQPYNGL